MKTIGYIATVLLLFFARLSDAQICTKWIAPQTANDQQNPLVGNVAVLKDAQKIYTSLCTPCHGDKGRGDGPVAAVLNPGPADHTSAVVQSETDGALFWKLSNGRGQMQPYKAKLSDTQRWALVNYIRSFRK